MDHLKRRCLLKTSNQIKATYLMVKGLNNEAMGLWNQPKPEGRTMEIKHCVVKDLQL